jgi:hypothetical protein
VGVVEKPLIEVVEKISSLLWESLKKHQSLDSMHTRSAKSIGRAGSGGGDGRSEGGTEEAREGGRGKGEREERRGYIKRGNSLPSGFHHFGSWIISRHTDIQYTWEFILRTAR